MTEPPSDDADDIGALLEDISRGDVPSVDRLLQRYLPQLRAFVRLRMDDGFRARESCSDLVQSICRELLADQSGFEYRGEAQFRGWLFTAALHKIREKQRFHRRNKRDIRLEVAPAGDADAAELLQSYAGLATPSQAAIAREQVVAIEAAFDTLPDDYREVITLTRVAGLSHDEVAEQMSRTVGAVRQLLGRALNKLAVELRRRS